MSRFLRATLLGLLVLVALLAGAGYLLLQDANRFKPQLEALIRERGGVAVSIDGDLSWRLWPPVSLSAAAVNADYQGQAWRIGRLTVDLDAWNALRDPRQWQVQSFTLADVTLEQGSSTLAVVSARLEDLAPNRPAPFRAELSYLPAPDTQPVPLTVNGQVQVDPDTLALALQNTRFTTTDAKGSCNLQVRPVADPVPAPAAGPADVVPVDVLRNVRWHGGCLLDWVRLDGHRFETVSVDLANDAGRSEITVHAPGFFGGDARARVHVDASGDPVRWTVAPTFRDVDSTALLAWLDQRELTWAAPLAYGGTLTMQGNSRPALLESISGETRFDGGQGRIDISKIRAQLIRLAEMFNAAERIRGWPEVWEYQRFVGTWLIDAEHHVLDAALDNLQLDGAGEYDPAADTMDMLLTLTFTDDPSLPVFDLDPLLYDLPIPVRCRGALAEPQCRIDPDTAQRIVAQALRGDDSELRSKLEQKIDEQVPEEYRDAARSLLDALGASLEQRADPPEP